jgi:hypothetical protein
MTTFTATWSNPTLTASPFPSTTFSTASVTAFTGTISAYNFSGGLTNGQYVIIIPASGGTITIIPPPTPSLNTINFNFSANITVSDGRSAIMTVVYDGAKYYVSCSAFNSSN